MRYWLCWLCSGGTSSSWLSPWTTSMPRACHTGTSSWRTRCTRQVNRPHTQDTRAHCTVTTTAAAAQLAAWAALEGHLTIKGQACEVPGWGDWRVLDSGNDMQYSVHQLTVLRSPPRNTYCNFRGFGCMPFGADLQMTGSSVPYIRLGDFGLSRFGGQANTDVG